MPRHRIRVSLSDVTPEIWRLFEIDGRMPLRSLHLALQTIIGWRESHLHAFTDGDPTVPGPNRPRRWAPSDVENPDGTLPDETFSIDDVLSATDTIWYEYDFGDGWIHRLDVVESIADDDLRAPVVLLDGANRAPFEDSGGPHGYAEKLSILDDPQHPEHREILAWVRATMGPWVPTTPFGFDPIGIQSELNLLFNPSGSGMSPHDMSGLVKDAVHHRPGDLTDASPLVMLAAELPPPIRAELRQHLSRTGVLIPAEIDDELAARIIHPFAWLMEVVGSDGLAVSSAGWMPPATVLAGMTELGWLDDWIGKGNREDLTPPIANLRETAQRMALVRVQKRRLVLGAAAKKALGHPRQQLRLVAGGLFRKLSDAEADAATLLLLSIADGTEPDRRWESVAFGLEMCGWASSTGRAFTPRDIDHATFHIQQVLDLIGDENRRLRRRHDNDGVRLFAAEALR